MCGSTWFFSSLNFSPFPFVWACTYGSALTSAMYSSIRSRTSCGFIASKKPPERTAMTPLLRLPALEARRTLPDRRPMTRSLSAARGRGIGYFFAGRRRFDARDFSLRFRFAFPFRFTAPAARRLALAAFGAARNSLSSHPSS